MKTSKRNAVKMMTLDMSWGRVQIPASWPSDWHWSTIQAGIEARDPYYEYTTRECQPDNGAPYRTDLLMEEDGWHRAWAYIAPEGCFIVYRRERL
jgi:hypothetical protein